jgi:thiamine biosynthesis lipoprotein
MKASLALALLALLILAPRAHAEEPLSRTEQVLWTRCTVALYDHATEATLTAAFDRLHEIQDHMGVSVPGSELDAIGEAAGRAPVQVSADLLAIILKMLDLARISDGLFDPTVGPLMKVWSMSTGQGKLPEPAAIAEARALVDWHEVVVDPAARTVYLKRAGMRLDAGGVLKGYAADEVVRILGSRGVRSALVDLGGDIFAVGHKPDGSSWQIGIQNPDSVRDTDFGVVGVVNKSVVTSGVYEHYFMHNGKRYHHIMDTRTGYPVDNGLTSVTVIAGTSIDADGLATTLFCLGPKDGLALARRLGVETIMITADHRLYATEAAAREITITDPSFTYASAAEGRAEGAPGR